VSEDRYRTRRPIPATLRLGGHAATRCPLRVVYEHQPPPDATPVPTPEPTRRRMESGTVFEAQIVDELLSHSPAHVRIAASPSHEQRVARTRDAMEQGAPLIVGGCLPDDLGGHRTGQPDVLLRAERRTDGSWAYHPVEVKHHATLQAAQDPSQVTRNPHQWTVQTSPLRLPGWHARRVQTGHRFAPSHRVADWLQLAHLWRMLDACGHASTWKAGAVIGKERQVVWAQLDDPTVRQTWATESGAAETALQRYDMEFSFRLDAVAAAEAGEMIVEPVNTFECSDCPWRHVCTPKLEAEHHVSLVPGVGYRAWRVYRHMGVQSESDLADIDRRSAELLDRWPPSGTTITALLEAGDAAAPDTALSSLLPTHARTAVALLESAGFARVEDLARFDRRLLPADRWLRRIARQIDNARIRAWAGSSPHRAPGVTDVIVPSADVEIDIDMESGLDGRCYLWGALHNPSGVYHGTANWSQDSAMSGAHVFVDFWALVGDWRRTAATSGQSIAFYCWNAHAEKEALRSGADLAAEVLGVDVRNEVGEFFESGQIVDLLVSFRDQVLTGQSNSLKAVAPLAGFTWEDDNPSGADSMLWHEIAVSERSAQPTAQQMRERLLTYNRNDCEATEAVRQWMRTTPLPSVLDLTLNSH